MNFPSAFMMSLLIFGQTLSGLGGGWMNVVCVGSEGHLAIERGHDTELRVHQGGSCCDCPQDPEESDDCVDIVLPDDEVRCGVTTSLLPLMPIAWPGLAASSEPAGRANALARSASHPPPWPPPHLGRLTGVVLQT